MRNNIPQELRKLAQWVGATETKRPINPRTGRPASVLDPSTWGSFEEAVASGCPHIGFVFTETDPYVFIDLDNKDEDPRLDNLHREIMESAGDTYVERSVSGKGFHIVVKASLAGGRRNSHNGLEIYPHGRYMLTTGNRVKGLEGRPNQELVDYLVGLCDKPVPEHVLPVRTDRPVLDDSEVLRSARALYGKRFETLNAGHWGHLHQSQSEADLELCAQISRFTSNNEQVRRLFLGSCLGQRPKAGQQKYLDGTIRRAREIGDREWAIREHGRVQAEKILASNARKQESAAASLLEPFFEFINKKVSLLKLVKGLLGESSLSVLYGAPGSGKSFLALDLCYAVATGQQWMGREVAQGPVIYACGEGVAGLRQRAKAVAKAKHSGNLPPMYFLPFGLSVSDDLEKFNLMLEQVKEEEGATPALLVIDTLSRSFGDGDENSAKDMKRFVSALASLMEKYPGLHILVVHHTGKDEERGMRGSSSLLGAVDTAIFCQKQKDRFVARVAKQKDGEEGGILPYVLEPVDLGHDEEGDPVASCIVRHDRDGRAQPLKGYLATAAAILRRLKADVSSRQHGNLAGLITPIPLQAYHNHWYLARPSDKKDSVRKNGRTQLKQLVKQGLIEWAEGDADIFPLPAFDSVTIDLGVES